jgi:predicted nucleic-acid-binding Zn-ribbon protein
MQITMKADNKCPKCGQLMRAEETAFGLPLYVAGQTSDRSTPVILASCPGCSYIELYLPKM